jgi:DNA gyrase subunit B
MRDLVERGRIYIAQPPLYKAKQSKKRFTPRTSTVEAASAARRPQGCREHAGRRPALAAESFGNVAREYLLAEAVIERLARIIDRADARSNSVTIDLATGRGQYQRGGAAVDDRRS